MSTVLTSEAGSHSTSDHVARESDCSPGRAAFVPRSVHEDTIQHKHGSATICSTGSPMTSNESSPLHIDPTSTIYTLSPTLFPPEHRASMHMNQVAADYAAQAQQSPRKSLPTHWLHKSTGPHLATAQRARERSHKQGTQSSSPSDVKTLRATRSSFDMHKPHIADGSTFLTKEALAAVETNITSPKSACNTTQHRRSLSRPSWQSPTASSSARSSPRGHVSVEKEHTFYTAGAGNQDRGTHPGGQGLKDMSKTDTSEESFHTAEGSPVRSPASSAESFATAAAFPASVSTDGFARNADGAGMQTAKSRATDPRMGKGTSNATAHVAVNRPRLALRIPPSGAQAAAGPTLAPPSSSMATVGTTPLDQNRVNSGPPQRSSRLPRVSLSSGAGNARIITQNSTLKRPQSMKPAAGRGKSQQTRTPNAEQTPLPDTSAVSNVRHVRTLDSLGSTPIISDASTKPSMSSSPSSDQLSGEVMVHSLLGSRMEGKPTSAPSEPLSEVSSMSESIGYKTPSDVSSRVSSASTIKPGSYGAAGVLADPAIISSRQQSGELDCEENSSTSDRDSRTDSLYEESATETFATETDEERGETIDEPSADIDLSDRSSTASDLRATAPEFKPQVKVEVQQTQLAEVPTPMELLLQPSRLFELDQYGIPWYHYMYPIYFQQPFTKGRARSPKKFKPKKQRSSMSVPAGAPNTSEYVASTHNSQRSEQEESVLRVSEATDRHDSPLISPSRVGSKQENEQPTCAVYQHVTDTHDLAPNSPFAAQFDAIAQQTSFVSRINPHTTHLPNVDLASVRNVGLPPGSRSLYGPDYYTVPNPGYRRHDRQCGNGLYGGRANAGVPIQASAPFPDPVPPQGRPATSTQTQPTQNVASTLGSEACGIVDIKFAAERVGGEACNACTSSR